MSHQHMYMGIWYHERDISKESEVGSLQSTDALSGHNNDNNSIIILILIMLIMLIIMVIRVIMLKIII